MKIKDFLRSHSQDSKVVIFDNHERKERMFHHIDEAIREFGYFEVISWEMAYEYGECIRIITRTQF